MFDSTILLRVEYMSVNVHGLCPTALKEQDQHFQKSRKTYNKCFTILYKGKF